MVQSEVSPALNTTEIHGLACVQPGFIDSSVMHCLLMSVRWKGLARRISVRTGSSWTGHAPASRPVSVSATGPGIGADDRQDNEVELDPCVS